MHGKGVYFAKDASYSHNYTDSSAQIRSMYRAKVLVGRCTQSRSDMKCPPEIPDTNERYNTVVDTPSSPSIYVTFFDDQVYEPYFVDFLRDAPEPTGDEPDDFEIEAPKIYETVRHLITSFYRISLHFNSTDMLRECYRFPVGTASPSASSCS